MTFARQLINGSNGSNVLRKSLNESFSDPFDDDEDLWLDEGNCCLGGRKIEKPIQNGLITAADVEREFSTADFGLQRNIDVSINHTFPLDDDEDDI